MRLSIPGPRILCPMCDHTARTGCSPTQRVDVGSRTPAIRSTPDSTRCSCYVLLCPMTDRPASWRMPTPKQMEKLAALVGREAAETCPAGPLDAMPLGRPRRPPRRRQAARPSGPNPTYLRCTLTRAAGLVPAVRAHRRNTEGRRGPTVRAAGDLERSRAATA
jgi:hypothetical protein